MKNRFLAWVLMLAALLSFLPLGAPTVYATPNTHPNTHVNSGDQRADILAVALTQVGYYEGPNNDTKYGVWYGYNNLGWCGIFVAWCANQAGIPTSVIARTGVPNPSAFGLAQQPSGYRPQPGDLFFSKSYSHVGLVYKVDGDYFYSLEGNTWEQGPEGVYKRRHRISDLVYASPNYQGGAEHSYTSAFESEHPHKEYRLCSHCSDRYYTGKTQTREDCTQCKQENCTHSYGNWQNKDSGNHERSCTKCKKTEKAKHNWNSGTVTTAATCGKNGVKTLECTQCGTTKTTVIQSSGKHTYGPWQATETNHGRRCTQCGHADSQTHKAASSWSSDGISHWRECTICSQKLQLADHSFGKTCASACEICQYKNPEGHRLKPDLSWNDTEHWRECEACEVQMELGPHFFSAPCDEVCNGCGFTRPTEHSFGESLQQDERKHWYECSVCGIRKDEALHDAPEAARSGAAVFCTQCHRGLTTESEHIHGYDSVTFSDSEHWGTCSCGLVMEPQNHAWSVKTGACAVCEAPCKVQSTDYTDLLPWAVSVGAILLVGVSLIVILSKRKRK